MSSHLKAKLAATCSTLGRLHKGEYLIEPECVESIKDLIRFLKKDDESHEIRRFLGNSKILQNDLIHIIKSCPEDKPELFDVTLRLLINLTTPAMLFYGEEVPSEKIGRNIYLSLQGHGQDYKTAFCDVEFWNKVCGKLTNLIEIDWTERSADDGIQIERILMLLRNVLQIPADVENEKRPEHDITVHDKVLWALRQSQILELLLFVASNKNEEQYYLNFLEIFSLILREQNPKLLAQCDIGRSTEERNQDANDLVVVRDMEKTNRNRYANVRNFNTTFVLKGVKSLSNNDVVSHKPLEKVEDLNVSQNKKHVRVRKNRIPVESERVERRSTFTVRLFLREFCLEFLNCGYSHLMKVVKNRLDSGKSLAHDQSYYFWALNFFSEFTIASDLDVNLIQDSLHVETFHFVQSSMENAFEHLVSDKKKSVDWVKRIHLILKAYHGLLKTLFWMDCSKNPLIRAVSREIKSQIFYVVEYREMTLHLLLRYDPIKFSTSYLRDLVETSHLFIKLLEEYSKQTKLVVQKITRKKSGKRKKKEKKTETEVETKSEKWEKIKDDVYDLLSSENLFPEIPPFDAALDIPIDDQKGRAMKKIQKCLHEGNIRDGIGLLRSSRQVWPENNYFGMDGMSVEDETMALQEICLADLEHVEGGDERSVGGKLENEEEDQEEEEEEEDEDSESKIEIREQDFDIMDYKKRLVNKKIVEGCGILLKNYKKNSDHTNHCVLKLLHRIGWECCMPAMLYQASLFWILLTIMNDKSRNFQEINTFSANLLRRFRKDAVKSPVIFLELLFWKEHNVALEIQHGYEPYENKEKPGRRSKKNVHEDIDKENPEERAPKKKGRRKKGDVLEEIDGDEVKELSETIEEEVKKRKKKQKKGYGGKKTVTKARKSKTKKMEDDKTKDSSDSAEENSFPSHGGTEDILTREEHNGEMNSDVENEESFEKSEGESISSRKKKAITIIDSSDEEDMIDNEAFRDKVISYERSGYSREEETNRDLDLPTRETLDEAESDEGTEKSGRVKRSEMIRSTEEFFADLMQKKDNDQSNDSSSRFSDASSKKRSRKDEKESTDNWLLSEDEEDDLSNAKRRRFIDSDSDVGNGGGSEEEEPRRIRTKRAVVIDSDSDMEVNYSSLNDNDIRNK